MTTPPVPRVDISNLSLGAEFGRGGQGKVVAVSGLRINGEWDAALKTYSGDVLSAMNPGVLEKIVALPRWLSAQDSRWLLENTAWPALVAEDRGRVAGFLMRAVPDACYFDFQTQTLGRRRKIADVAFLLNSDQYVGGSGLAVTERNRLELLGSLAGLLSRLHGLGAVAGDLSPKNILFSLAPTARCFLIDCDAVQLHGETVLRQVETPDWEVPPGEPGPTPATDAFKFGLLAIRLFARDQASRDPAALRALSPELGRFAELSQHPDPRQRPDPGAWAAALVAAVSSASAAPTVAQPVAPPAQISVPVPTVQADPPRAPAAPAAPAATAPAAPVAPPGAGTPAAAGPAVSKAPLIRRLTVAAVTLAAVITGLVFAVPRLTAQPTASDSTPPAVIPTTPATQANTSNTQPSTPAVPTPQPTAVGVVTVGDSIAGNPDAVAVATILNTYFHGINEHYYSYALSVFDPASPLHPQWPTTRHSLRAADATTTDSDVVLTGLVPSGSGPVREAYVTFRSNQSPGYGPYGAADQTCTIWNLTYTLTESNGQYYIYNARGTNSGC